MIFVSAAAPSKFRRCRAESWRPFSVTSSLHFGFHLSKSTSGSPKCRADAPLGDPIQQSGGQTTPHIPTRLPKTPQRSPNGTREPPKMPRTVPRRSLWTLVCFHRPQHNMSQAPRAPSLHVITIVLAVFASKGARGMRGAP